jgi:hypothetical protein
MAGNEMPSRISQNVSMQQIGAETLVYDGQRHLAFCLNASSGAVWKMADGTRTMAQIAHATSLEIGAEVSEVLAGYIVETLRADGLLEPTTQSGNGNGVEATPGISRRAMLQRLGVGGAMLLPVVASIAAPTAAQAYNGCVDCSTSNSRAARIRKLQQSRSSQ